MNLSGCALTASDLEFQRGLRVEVKEDTQGTPLVNQWPQPGQIVNAADRNAMSLGHGQGHFQRDYPGQVAQAAHHMIGQEKSIAGEGGLENGAVAGSCVEQGVSRRRESRLWLKPVRSRIEGVGGQ